MIIEENYSFKKTTSNFAYRDNEVAKITIPLTVLSRKQAKTPPHKLGLINSNLIIPSVVADPTINCTFNDHY